MLCAGADALAVDDLLADWLGVGVRDALADTEDEWEAEWEAVDEMWVE